MLSTLASSCQKEENSYRDGIVTEQPNAAYSLNYSIDGQHYSATFNTPEEKEAFVIQLLASARQGHSVTIRSHQSSQVASKETITYETKDPKKAAIWALTMEGLGYDVTISFNEETGIYTCVATN